MHLVETMAYAGEKPWHGLGNRLAPQQPIEVWKRQAGMDWKIEEVEVRYVAGNHNLGVIHAFPEQKVLYRSDNRTPLSVVSKRFQVVQPGQILEFYRDLTASSGFELETAGVLREGRKFWALARTGQSATLKGRDKVDGYLLLATACDGTLATTAQFTSVRVVCNNTLSIALGNATGAIKVPHRSQFDPDVVKRQLGITVSSWDGFVARMKALVDRPVDHQSGHEGMCGLRWGTLQLPGAYEQGNHMVVLELESQGCGFRCRHRRMRDCRKMFASTQLRQRLFLPIGLSERAQHRMLLRRQK